MGLILSPFFAHFHLCCISYTQTKIETTHIVFWYETEFEAIVPKNKDSQIVITYRVTNLNYWSTFYRSSFLHWCYENRNCEH